MVTRSHRAKRVLLLAPNATEWPEPLPGLVAQGILQVTCVAGMYEAAVAFVNDGHRSIYGIALDVAELSSGDFSALRTLRLRAQVPIWIFPFSTRFAQRAEQAFQHGAMAWDKAAVALAGIAYEPLADVGAAEKSSRGDNAGMDRFAIPNGIPVTADIAARYDGSSVEPLLSREEINALLGAAE